MKKTLLAISMLASATLIGYSQGGVYFNNSTANGYVVTSANGASSSAADATYAVAGSFTAQLWAINGNVQSTSGLTGIDAYGFLNPANLVSDNFNQVVNVGNVAGSDGIFATPTAASVQNNVGAFPYVNGNPGSGVVAVVAWTGSATTFATALTQWQAGSIFMGILAFEQQFGPGGQSPSTPDLSQGWNQLANSPNSAANSIGGSSQDLIMTKQPSGVPEPSTLALAGLGGFGMLMAMRRKKA